MHIKHRRWLLRLVLAALVAVLVVLLSGRLKTDIARQSAQSVKDAVLRSAVQCYSVEGVYPSSVDYLEEHYGLMIDHDTYIIGYDSFSSNLLPQVSVLVRGDEQGADQ
jgi:hypothetical protein